MLLRKVFHINEQILEFLFELLPLCCAISSSYSASLDLNGDKKTRAIKLSQKAWAKLFKVDGSKDC